MEIRCLLHDRCPYAEYSSTRRPPNRSASSPCSFFSRLFASVLGYRRPRYCSRGRGRETAAILREYPCTEHARWRGFTRARSRFASLVARAGQGTEMKSPLQRPRATPCHSAAEAGTVRYCCGFRVGVVELGRACAMSPLENGPLSFQAVRFQ